MDQAGWIEMQSFTITEPTPLVASLTASDYGSYNITCFGEADGFITSTTSGGTPPYTYQWNDGATTANRQNIGAGQYDLIVTDANGCQVFLQQSMNQPNPITYNLTVVNPDCTNGENGSISVQATGGATPILYDLNNQGFTNKTSYPSLDAGTYVLTLQDVNGCELDTTVVMPSPDELLVDLGDDIYLELGDSVMLSPTVTFDPSQINWAGAGGLSCDTCLTPMIRPFESVSFTLTAITEDGCVEFDQINIFVNRDRDIFVPTVFSPNDDGINDILMVFANSANVVQVKEFGVFDRWGETMFSLNDFQPNDPQYGWDGKHRGQKMQPAVFVWMAEIEYIDGETRLFTGDVTLLR